MTLGLALACGALLGAWGWRSYRVSPGDTVNAFYFWKVRWAPSSQELQSLNDLNIQRLYLRFFDVDWDVPQNYPTPVAPLQLAAPLPDRTAVVPVIFIKNQVFQKLSSAQLPKFADQVWSKTNQMADLNGISFQQWQIDCDWSDTTRDRYFRFLELIKAKSHQRGLTLSSTIRLHQVKYPARTGVPPVDRGMLMFYNMGQLQTHGHNLSIYNTADAQRYTPAIHNYKLPMDVVLPIFSWLVHSRMDHILGLVDKTDVADLGPSGFVNRSEREYVASRSVFLNGIFYKKGDLISVEEITPALTREAANLLARSFGRHQRPHVVAFFDFDERNLKKYEKADLRKVFNSFN